MKLNTTVQNLAGSLAYNSSRQREYLPFLAQQEGEEKLAFLPTDRFSQEEDDHRLSARVLKDKVFISIKERLQLEIAGQEGQQSGLTLQYQKEVELYGKIKGKDAIPSPEESAATIVSFSTGFFDMYRSRHPELSDEEALREFELLIRGSIQEGAMEALQIIQGLSRDNEETMGRIKTTLAKVEEGLQAFFQHKYVSLLGEDASYSSEDKDEVSLERYLGKLDPKED